jgi:hypothetical protein
MKTIPPVGVMVATAATATTSAAAAAIAPDGHRHFDSNFQIGVNAIACNFDINNMFSVFQFRKSDIIIIGFSFSEPIKCDTAWFHTYSIQLLSDLTSLL